MNIIKKINSKNEDKKEKYKRNKLIVILITIIWCIITVLHLFTIFEYSEKISYFMFILDIVSMIICFYICVKSISRINIEEMQAIKIENLEAHNKTLSIEYDTIRGFRHDYSNFILALDGYAKVGNLEGVRKLSQSVLLDCEDVNNMGVLNPTIINNPAIYNLITKKYYIANSKNIRMKVEVMINLENDNFYNYDVCRILGILLDNAIEAASECKNKIVNVRFIKDNFVNRNLIIIENTYNNVDINIDDIFEKGYSTKTKEKDKHGLGLWTVKKLLCRNENLSLYTTKSEFFCQQLEIYDN